MVQIAGVNFYIEYHPGTAGGFSAAQVADLISKLTTLFANSQIQQFLAPLAGRDVYLTTSWPQAWTSRNGHNTQAIGPYNYFDNARMNGGVLTGSFTSGQVDANGDYLSDQTLSSFNLETHNVIAFDAGQMADYSQPGGVRAINASGVSYDQTLYRVIFHELAHLVSLPDSAAASAFGDTASTNENIAIAAEDLIYAPVNGQPSRVGHNYILVQGHKSNDPNLAFRHVTSNVVFSEGISSGGQYNASFSGYASGGKISKTYYASGVDAAGQNVAGQIFLDALADDDIVNSNGSATPLLKDLLSGVAHDNSTESRIASASRLLGQLASEKAGVLASLGAATLTNESLEFLSTLTDASLVGVRRASGVSDEMSADHSMFSGPIFNVGGPAKETPIIAQKSIAGGILIGASGAEQLNVNFTNRSDKLVGLDDVTNVLVAGSGGGNGSAANELVGGSGNDILIGGKGDDLLYADKGNDVVIQSAGNDLVVGDGKTVFVASEANKNPIFDTNVSIGGEYILGNGAGYGGTTLYNVSTFVGNQTRTTFVGNGKTPATFIAGAGGGDFTLTDGDTAIGNPDVVNIYRLSTALIDGHAPTVTILNLGPKDIILVDGKKFNGNIHTYSVTPGQDGAYAVNEKGTSSWKTEYSKSVLTEELSEYRPWIGGSTPTEWLLYQIALIAGGHPTPIPPPIYGGAQLSPGRSSIMQTGNERRDVAFVRSGTSTSSGTIVFTDVQGGARVAGLNLSVTGFENGKSAGGVYFSTNNLVPGSDGVPEVTGQFGPSDSMWQDVYPSIIASQGPQPVLDLSTPASSLGQPFNPTQPTTVYPNKEAPPQFTAGDEDLDPPATLTGDGNANVLAFAQTYGIIVGGGGGDTIEYALGDGSVLIDETDPPNNPDNVLAFGPGIGPGDVSVHASNAGDLILSLASGEEITLAQALRSTNDTRHGVQKISFDDGTSWSYDELVTRAAVAVSAASPLYGDRSEQIFDSQGIAHSIIGGGGGDTIIYERGYGTLSVFEAENDSAATNTLRFGGDITSDDTTFDGDLSGDIIISLRDSGDRIILKGALANAASNPVRYGVQTIEFANGEILTINDVIDSLWYSGGRATQYGDGNSQTINMQGVRGIVGGGGGDLFLYDSGYGSVVINELDTNATANNVLQIGSGLSSDQLSVTADSRGNLILDFGGADRITLTGALLSVDGAIRGLQSVIFTGENNLTLSYADLLARADTPSAVNTKLYGDADANAFDSVGIAHSITGGGGGDTIAYDRGYGSLTVTEVDLAVTADNELHFVAGITTGDVAVSSTSGGDIVLDLGNGDQVTLTGALKNSATVQNGVQKVVFDDGTVWTYADLLAALTTATATRTVLAGDASANSFDPLGLATMINGGGGGDTIQFNSGYGNLTIDERELDFSKTNTLVFGAGIDPANLTVHGTATGDLVLSVGLGDQVILKNMLGTTAYGTPGVQKVTFADGTTITATDLFAMVRTASATNTDIYGSASSDILDGLGIAHTATGGGGGDAFVFQRGYGALTINERDLSSMPDNVLVFGDGIEQGDLAISANSNGDLVFDLGGGDQVVVTQALHRDDQAVLGIQNVLFADGTSLSYDDLISLVTAAVPGQSDLYGNYDANTLDGHGIVEHVVGGGGGDTFVFDQGYGSLTIDESDIVGGAPNVLQFGAGILTSDVTVTANAVGDLILNLAGGDQVNIRGALGNIDGSGTVVGVQQVTFEDGTSWSYDDLIDRLTSDGGVIYGDSNAQNFNLDGSANTIVGRGGGDRIHYLAGQGALTINEVDSGIAPDNSLLLDASISPSQVSVTDDGNGNAVLSFGGTDQVTVLGQFSAPGGTAVSGVQRIVFADGTTWTSDDLKQFAMATLAYVVGGPVLSIDEATLPASGRPALAIDTSIAHDDVDVVMTNGDTVTLSHGGEDIATFSNIWMNGALADQKVSFGDGTILSLADLVESLPVNSDYVGWRGSTAAETFDTQGKAARLTGGGGSDTFIYGRGYGQVEISESNAVGTSTSILQLSDDIDPSDVTVSGIQGGSIVLALDDLSVEDGDQVTLLNALRSNAATSYGVQEVRFHDGTVWHYADLLARVGQVSGPNAALFGDKSAQTFDTQGISPSVVGGGGGDTIIYHSGYGYLHITEVEADPTAINVLEFASGILPASVSVEGTSAGDITLSLGGDDKIVLDGQAAPGVANQGLQEIHFADGTVWDRADLLDLAYPDGNYPESGGAFEGDAGDNDLTGSAGADVLIGHAGNDTLSGRGGNDEYRYASGEGNDVITDNGLSSDTDVLRLTDLNPADVSLSRARSGNDLIVRDDTTGQQITVTAEFQFEGGGIEQISFADGTVWDETKIGQEAWILGDASNNSLSGSSGSETLVGGLGNDSLSGGAGSDTYRYASGDGADEIGENGNPSDADTLKLTDLNPADVALSRDGLDLLVTDTTTGQSIRVDIQFVLGGYGIEQIAFADGTTWNRQAIAKNAPIVGDAGDNYLSGSDDSEIFRGAQGNDYSWGGGGSDDYLYASGDGNDQIDDSGSAADVDRLVLTDIASTGVELRRDGTNLILKISSTGQEIDVLNQFYSDASHGIEQISFSDGATWNRNDIATAAWIRGGSSDDALSGTGSDDVLVGAGGADYLEGKGGSDEYRYASGDGNDRIHESGASSDNDTLVLSNLDPVNVTVSRDGRDLKVHDRTTGQVITVNNQFYGDESYSIEHIAFADGTIWDRSDIAAHVQDDQTSDILGTAGDDTLFGTNGNDTLNGGAGNDTLTGGDGSDVYVFAEGDGQDSITDTRAVGIANVVQFGSGITPGDIYVYTANAGADIVLGRLDSTDTVTISAMNEDTTKGVDEVHFADGTVWSYADIMARRTSFTAGNDTINGTSGDETLYGGAGNDTMKGLAGNDVLDGGTGNDTLSGGDGDDVYRFASGDGQDRISDYSSGGTGPGGVDTIRLGAGILPANVTVSEANSGNDLVLTFAGSTDAITISSAINQTLFRIEQVAFADGINWSYADLMAKATTPTSGDDTFYGDEGNQTLQGGAGNDKLFGRAGDDILVGGVGNDKLDGGPGSDTFVFAQGDGNDTIADSRVSGLINSVQLGAGITAQNTFVTASANGLDIVVGFVDSSDTITISYMNLSGVANGIDQIQFTDGSSWSYADIMARRTAFTAGDDTITGTSGNETLYGGDGNDTLLGLAGDDSLAGGAGNDTLTGGAGNDVLNGGSGSDTAAFAGLQNDYQLTTTGGSLSITDLQPTVSGDDGTDQLIGVETAQFSDQSVSLAAPVILDLDGNGVTLVDRAQSATSFDWNGDGITDHTGWIGQGDAFLALDRNHDGRIDSAAELSFANDKPGAKSDLDGLSAFDSNGDGKLSADDSAFGDFRVWQDADANGLSDAGELKSLADVGIAAIDLAGSAVNQSWAWDANVTINTGAFERTDGSVGQLADAALNYEPSALLPAVGIAADLGQRGRWQMPHDWAKPFDPLRLRMPISPLRDFASANGDLDHFRTASSFSEQLAAFEPESAADGTGRNQGEKTDDTWFASHRRSDGSLLTQSAASIF
jgi:Ca2+-binding RTX toxin-like protein